MTLARNKPQNRLSRTMIIEWGESPMSPPVPMGYSIDPLHHRQLHDPLKPEAHHPLHLRHNRGNVFVVQFKNAVKDTNFIISEWFFSLSVELQERPRWSSSVRPIVYVGTQ